MAQSLENQQREHEFYEVAEEIQAELMEDGMEYDEAVVEALFMALEELESREEAAVRY